MKEKSDKICGALYAAAIGNAMGAATESRTTEMVLEHFGHYVERFEPHPEDNYAKDAMAGEVTADFSVAYVTAHEMLVAKSFITEQIAKSALLKWYAEPRYRRYVGPTSEHAFYALRGLKAPFNPDDYVLCRAERATNGAAVKAGLMGLFRPADIQAAQEDAVIMCLPTHNNTVALSGACAVAASVSEAVRQTSSYITVIEAGITGARDAMENTKNVALPNVGCSVEKRIEIAVALGVKYAGDFERAMEEITGLIGTSQLVYESVPAVFGMIAACRGDIVETIKMAVNAGGDSDTTACIAGYICGALNGTSSLDTNLCEEVDRVNGYDIKELAAEINRFAEAGEKI